MTNANGITNISVYTSEMQKSLKDKLWFLPKIHGVDTVVDYGCANGILLSAIHQYNTRLRLIGYDNNNEMIKLAQTILPDATFYNKFNECIKKAKNTPFALVASSVIHEIFNYSLSPRTELNRMFNCGAKYIAIRDMFYSDMTATQTNPNDLAKLKAFEPASKIEEFEKCHGSLTIRKNFVHYLLTYRYTVNWTRECPENYFPMSIEDFIKIIPQHYGIQYVHTYTLPFVQQTVHHDFGIDICEHTHAKILLKLK